MAVFKIDRSKLRLIEDDIIFDILYVYKPYSYSRDQIEVVLGRKFFTIRIDAHYCGDIYSMLKSLYRKNKLIASSKSIKWLSDWHGDLFEQ